jgi:hypothetical protein
MITFDEIDRLIYKDKDHLVVNTGWVDRFYELWLERYHALNIVKSPSDVLKLSEKALEELVKRFRFDEMHLFKIFEGANVFALLKEQGGGYWSYEFIIIYKDQPDIIVSGLHTVEAIKDHFNHKEPMLEIPLPFDRKYQED